MAQRAKGWEDLRRLAEGDEAHARGGRRGEDEPPGCLLRGRRHERECEGGTVGGGDGEGRAPDAQLAHQFARVVRGWPAEQAGVATQGGEPRVVDGLVAAGVGFKRRTARASG